MVNGPEYYSADLDLGCRFVIKHVAKVLIGSLPYFDNGVPLPHPGHCWGKRYDPLG